MGRRQVHVGRSHVEVDVADEVLTDEEEPGFAERVRKLAVLELLRQRKISQSRAAEMLNISRAELFDLMSEVNIPHIYLELGELEEDVKGFGQNYRQYGQQASH